MAEKLQKTLQGTGASPQFNMNQYFSTVQQVMQNPQFMSMAEWLGTTLMQDPSMDGVLRHLVNPLQKNNMKQRMAQIKEKPSLKHVLDEIEIGGPTAMMKYCNNTEVLQKLGEAMGFAV